MAPASAPDTADPTPAPGPQEAGAGRVGFVPDVTGVAGPELLTR